MTDPALGLLSEAEYLAAETRADVRHEYVDGFVYAQARATKAHGRVAANLVALLHGPAAQQDCWVYASDLRVRLSQGGQRRHYYPDLVVSCGEEGENDCTAEENLCLIVEILSTSTRRIDLSFKLQGYLVVVSEAQGAHLYKRRADTGDWTREAVQPAVTLPYVGVRLQLADLYARTGIIQQAPEEG